MEAPLALYRRYRPETFAEVIGQDHVTAPLRNALSNNRVNHAYLFSGPRGCGKTTSARILARAINCEKGPIAEPCGVCKSCTDLARGGPGSIDVIEIDAASHGGVDDARDLRERAFFAPVESRYKIYIIDEAHMVTTQGFNALLKLVEEPPPHLKFIFATTEPDKVIGTIRSRTHHYPFRLVPPKALGDYMATLCEAEGVSIEPAALPLVVRAGAGSVRDSLSVLDQLIGGAGPAGVTYELAVALLGFTPDSLLDACVDGFAAHDSRAVFETVEKVIETGQDPKRFAEDLLRRLRDLVVLSAVPNAVVSGLIEAAEDQGERLQTQAAGIGAAELTRAADIVAAGLLEMRGATAPRLQLELICAKVLLPGADDSTNGIQARLDRMERRMSMGVPVAADAGGSLVASGPAPDAASSRAAARAAAGGLASDAGTADAPPAAAAGSEQGEVAAGSGAEASDGVPGGAGAADGGHAAAANATGESESGSVAAGGGVGPASGVPGVLVLGVRAACRVGLALEVRRALARRGVAGGRQGAWGDEPAASGQQGVSGQQSAASQQQPATAAQQSGATAQQAASAPVGSPSVGAVGLADVRRLWPQVLDAVKAKRRFAWIMLSQNSQVIAVDDQTLTLGMLNAGARESFARSGSDEILRQAMIDTIGLNRRIEAVVDPSADPGAGGGGGAAPRAGGPQGGASAPGGSAAGGGNSPGGGGGFGGAGNPAGAGGVALRAVAGIRLEPAASPVVARRRGGGPAGVGAGAGDGSQAGTGAGVGSSPAGAGAGAGAGGGNPAGAGSGFGGGSNLAGAGGGGDLAGTGGNGRSRRRQHGRRGWGNAAASAVVVGWCGGSLPDRAALADRLRARRSGVVAFPGRRSGRRAGWGSYGWLG